MKIYVENTDNIQNIDNGEIKSELLDAISKINKKLGTKISANPTFLIDVKFIPLNLQISNIINVLVKDYSRLSSNIEKIKRLEKIEQSVKNLQDVWDKK